jgi:hypothetical protein
MYVLTSEKEAPVAKTQVAWPAPNTWTKRTTRHATNGSTASLGRAGYLGELRQGPDDRLYRRIAGVNSLGIPFGFWQQLERAKERAREALRRAREAIRGRLAATILNSPNITLSNAHVSGVNDNATARQNIEDTANGRPASRSNYGNAPGGTVSLDLQLLSRILKLAETYSFSISELAGGSHSANSRHYAGVTMDVNVINGQHVSNAHPNFRSFMRDCRALGATQVLGPGDAGHARHIHCAWPRP